jgi:uncharacterized membrane protein YqgA involved in biofilm formation
MDAIPWSIHAIPWSIHAIPWNIHATHFSKAERLTIPWGPIINAIAVAAGGTLGLFLGRVVSERMRTLVFQLFGLCLTGIALNMILKSLDSIILIILACALGAVTGEILKLSDRLDSMGDWLKKVVKSSHPHFTEGLVTSSVLVCAGAMSIVGAIEEGVERDRTTVFTKSMIDFFAVIILASRSGAGVIFCSITVLVYQGTLTMLAGTLQPFISPGILQMLTGTGGVLVLGIAFNMIGLKTPVNISSSLPALAYAVVLPWAAGLVRPLWSGLFS